MESFQLIVNGKAEASLVGLIRQHTGASLSHIKRALVSGAPLVNENIHHNTYDAFIARISGLLQALEQAPCTFVCVVDGEDEPLEYVYNVFKQWHEIGQQLDQEDNLRARGGAS